MSQPELELKLGTSTYAFFWEWSDRNPEPISLREMISVSSQMGANHFQICDYPKIEELSSAEAQNVVAYGRDHGVTLELGTRGTTEDRLGTYVDLAETMGIKVLRSMVRFGPGEEDLAQVEKNIRAVIPRLESLGIDLAFETYEQLDTETLVNLIETIGHERVGIALDPANCVANLELPRDVIARCAPYTLNLHVKDFAFTRQAGWVGFTYAGAPMGEGLLDYDDEITQVRPREKGISQIVEHWLTWQGDIQTTVAMERQWTQQSINYIRRNEHV
ncbi:sugar phosphate isomerase/epimerase family protein [Actinotignum timonense]|uniref:sugar phosphate isomerase/epimerase family protein n=1 Tax=Actinotignum timonense TaxID=1870995 RepID=UPI0038985492|nr:TIM barrel protein [Gleimia europaea]